MFSDVIVERVTVEGTSEIIIAAVSSDVIVEELVMSQFAAGYSRGFSDIKIEDYVTSPQQI